MKIVAFMQNMWLKNPASFHRGMDSYAGDEIRAEAYRRRIIHYALFAGCLTGRRLKAAFGEELCKQIVWDESTREVADNPKTVFPADLIHIRKVINQEKPDVILSFGGIAAKAVHIVLVGMMAEEASFNIRHITSSHPAARQPETVVRLKEVGDALNKLVGQPVAPSP
jgi:hypothetical protein